MHATRRHGWSMCNSFLCLSCLVPVILIYHVYDWVNQSTFLVQILLRDSRYSSPPLIRTPLLTNNSVLTREVSFGEREHYIHSWYLLPRICVFSRECPLSDGPLYQRLSVWWVSNWQSRGWEFNALTMLTTELHVIVLLINISHSNLATTICILLFHLHYICICKKNPLSLPFSSFFSVKLSQPISVGESNMIITLNTATIIASIPECKNMYMYHQGSWKYTYIGIQ